MPYRSSRTSKRLLRGAAVALVVGALLCASAIASASSISGTISVVATKLKTEGGKSDKDVVVYLEKVGGDGYPTAPSEPATVDQVGSVFIPHVLPVQAGTTIEFLNSDSFEHNVFSPDECCEFNLGNFAGGAKGSYEFNNPGEAVILCKLHPEMAAYVVVLATPYFSTAEIDGPSQSGSYNIEDVPPGDYVLHVWNKRTEAPPLEVTLGEGESAQADIDLQKKVRKKRKRGK